MSHTISSGSKGDSAAARARGTDTASNVAQTRSGGYISFRKVLLWPLISSIAMSSVAPATTAFAQSMSTGTPTDTSAENISNDNNKTFKNGEADVISRDGGSIMVSNVPMVTKEIKAEVNTQKLLVAFGKQAKEFSLSQLADMEKFCNSLQKYGLFDKFIEEAKNSKYSEKAYSSTLNAVLEKLYPELEKDETYRSTKKEVQSIIADKDKRMDEINNSKIPEGLKTMAEFYHDQDIIVANLKLRGIIYLLKEGKKSEAEDLLNQIKQDDKAINAADFLGAQYSEEKVAKSNYLLTSKDSDFENLYKALSSDSKRFQALETSGKMVVIGGETTVEPGPKGIDFGNYNAMIRPDRIFSEGIPTHSVQMWNEMLSKIAEYSGKKIVFNCPGFDPERGRWTEFINNPRLGNMYFASKVGSHASELWFIEFCKEHKKFSYTKYSYLGRTAYQILIKAIEGKSTGTDWMAKADSYTTAAKRLFEESLIRSEALTYGYYDMFIKKGKLVTREVNDVTNFLYENNAMPIPQDVIDDLKARSNVEAMQPSVDKEQVADDVFIYLFAAAWSPKLAGMSASEIRSVVNKIKPPLPLDCVQYNIEAYVNDKSNDTVVLEFKSVTVKDKDYDPFVSGKVKFQLNPTKLEFNREEGYVKDTGLPVTMPCQLEILKEVISGGVSTIEKLNPREEVKLDKQEKNMLPDIKKRGYKLQTAVVDPKNLSAEVGYEYSNFDKSGEKVPSKFIFEVKTENRTITKDVGVISEQQTPIIVVPNAGRTNNVITFNPVVIINKNDVGAKSHYDSLLRQVEEKAVYPKVFVVVDGVGMVSKDLSPSEFRELVEIGRYEFQMPTSKKFVPAQYQETRNANGGIAFIPTRGVLTELPTVPAGADKKQAKEITKRNDRINKAISGFEENDYSHFKDAMKAVQTIEKGVEGITPKELPPAILPGISTIGLGTLAIKPLEEENKSLNTINMTPFAITMGTKVTKAPIPPLELSYFSRVSSGSQLPTAGVTAAAAAQASFNIPVEISAINVTMTSDANSVAFLIQNAYNTGLTTDQAKELYDNLNNGLSAYTQKVALIINNELNQEKENYWLDSKMGKVNPLDLAKELGPSGMETCNNLLSYTADNGKTLNTSTNKWTTALTTEEQAVLKDTSKPLAERLAVLQRTNIGTLYLKMTLSEASTTLEYSGSSLFSTIQLDLASESTLGPLWAPMKGGVALNKEGATAGIDAVGIVSGENLWKVNVKQEGNDLGSFEKSYTLAGVSVRLHIDDVSGSVVAATVLQDGLLSSTLQWVPSQIVPMIEWGFTVNGPIILGLKKLNLMDGIKGLTQTGAITYSIPYPGAKGTWSWSPRLGTFALGRIFGAPTSLSADMTLMGGVVPTFKVMGEMNTPLGMFGYGADISKGGPVYKYQYGDFSLQISFVEGIQVYNIAIGPKTVIMPVTKGVIPAVKYVSHYISDSRAFKKEYANYAKISAVLDKKGLEALEDTLFDSYRGGEFTLAALGDIYKTIASMDKEGVDKIKKDKEFLFSIIDTLGMVKMTDPDTLLAVRQLRQDKGVKNMNELLEVAPIEVKKTINREKAEEYLNTLLAYEAHDNVVKALVEGKKPDMEQFPCISEKDGSYYIKFPSYKHIETFMYTKDIKPKTKGAYDYFDQIMNDKKIETSVWRGTWYDHIEVKEIKKK